MWCDNLWRSASSIGPCWFRTFSQSVTFFLALYLMATKAQSLVCLAEYTVTSPPMSNLFCTCLYSLFKTQSNSMHCSQIPYFPYISNYNGCIGTGYQGIWGCMREFYGSLLIMTPSSRYWINVLNLLVIALDGILLNYITIFLWSNKKFISLETNGNHIWIQGISIIFVLFVPFYNDHLWDVL